MFKTRITEMLGIEHPIIMGSMGLISDARLAAAVSDAGGLGFITSVAMAPPGAQTGNMQSQEPD